MRNKKVKSVLFEYENEWVLTDRKYSKVFLSNKDLDKLQKETKKRKIKDAVISFVPPRDTALSL